VDINHLRTALALLEHRTVNRTAAELGIAPSSVSDRVRRLEWELGAALFVRTTRGMRPSAAGREFLGTAGAVVSDLDRAGARLRESPPIVIGAQASVAHTLVAPVLDGLPEGLAQRVTLAVDGDRSRILSSLVDHEIDAAVLLDRGDSLGDLGFDVPAASLDSLDLSDVPMRSVAGAGHRLAGRPVSTRDLRTGTTMLGREERCSFWMATRSWLGPDTDLVAVGGLPQVREWAAAGRGVAVLPEFAVTGDLATGRLVALDVETPPLRLRLVWHRERAEDPSVLTMLYALSRELTRPRTTSE